MHMPMNLQAIVLAAGQSKRFKTGRSKLSEKICGREMVLYPINLLSNLAIHTTVVIGYQKEIIQEIISSNQKQQIQFEIQEEQHGTGHAILCARNAWQEEHILILNGDMPLLTEEIIVALYNKHIKENAAISFVIAHNDDPSGAHYSRVINDGRTIKIVEAEELSGDLHEHCYVNAGVYIVSKQFLEENIQEIEQNEVKNEFIASDLVKIASRKNLTITSISAPFDCIRGINNMQELWAAEQVKRAELIRHWMAEGVRFASPHRTHLDVDVTIGAGTYIGADVDLFGRTSIGKQCKIEPYTMLENATLESNVSVYSHSVIKNAHISAHAQVGPFAHVHSSSYLDQKAVIGNFVEVTRSSIGRNSKAKHLTYLGDAQIGAEVNIGAGTITCNYNGIAKQKTIIQDNAFIGSNNSLVAPVTIEKNAYTAAGSVITENVPEGNLGIGRARQVNKAGYAEKVKGQKTKNPAQARTQDAKPQSISFIGAVKTKNEVTS
jgi:bifunctional UDP-N-acetylglucosamine pyrophosphorylase/glucosamine-1-phosphate N-acetyltransferase